MENDIKRKPLDQIRQNIAQHGFHTYVVTGGEGPHLRAKGTELYGRLCGHGGVSDVLRHYQRRCVATSAARLVLLVRFPHENQPPIGTQTSILVPSIGRE